MHCTEIFLSKKGENFFCPKKERGRRRFVQCVELRENFWGQICEESEASKQAERGILSQGPHKRAH